MATSGTVNTTVIATDTLLTHAMRRCGVSATAQTPEIIDMAKECLFFLMLSLASRGLNLWCVDKQVMDSVVGQRTYVLPLGTLSVLNAVYSTATYVTPASSATTTTSYTSTLSTATTVARVGVTFSVLPTADITYQFSDDNATWTTAATLPVIQLATNTRYWTDMNIVGSHLYYRIYAAGTTFTATEFQLASTVKDLSIKSMNRDDYSALPDKNAAGNPATNYFFEKLVNPTITLWPVPNVAGNQFCVWRHRQIQDVGSLTQTIELPNRWLEAIIWQLAIRLCYELPSGMVPPDRMASVGTMTSTMLIEVEGGETDNAPTFYTPGISVYTK